MGMIYKIDDEKLFKLSLVINKINAIEYANTKYQYICSALYPRLFAFFMSVDMSIAIII